MRATLFITGLSLALSGCGDHSGEYEEDFNLPPEPYNSQDYTHNTQGDPYNSQQTAYNTQANPYNSQQNAYNTQANPYNTQRMAGNAPGEQGATPGQGQASGKVLHPIHDRKTGMLMVEMPFPSSWKISRGQAQGAPSITGPNGLQVFDFPAQNFVYTPDPQMQQMYYQSGQQMRAMPGIDGLIQQDVVPWASQQGLRLIRKFDMPQVAQVDRWYQQQLYQAVPSQLEHAVVGSDWENANGDKFFLMTHVVISSGQGLQMWYYYSRGLQAQANYFDTAKQDLIYGLANARYNPQHIQAYNQREAQKAGQSWAAHNQRMRNNQANFESTQRAITSANDAVNDSIMQGWRDRNASQDRMQDQFTDYIRDENTMIDPSSGQTWKVDSGANEYWINADGEYIPSDNYNYNPNLDPSVNNQDWQQLEEYRR